MEWIINLKLFRYFNDLFKTKSFYGLEGISIYNVVRFFLESLKKGSILQYSSALTFNFFLAIFPSIIFVFTLIAYIPIENFKDKLFAILNEIMPPNAFAASEEIIFDIINNNHGGLLSVGFFGALIFATSGVNSLMEVLNKIIKIKESRSFILKRLTALGLTVLMSLIVFISIIFIIIGGVLLNYLVDYGIIESYFIVYLVRIIEIFIIFLVYFFSISFLYYYGPANRQKNKKFITIGSFLATILSIISSIGFSFYITNFSSYNKLYGSIGTLIIFLLWIYLNSITLLLGFELNSSISRAKRALGTVKQF